MFHFPKHFPEQKLKAVPLFDGRLVCYPTEENLRDYFSWRQADCHINNLYNTCFWSLVQKDGVSQEEAHNTLKNTFSDFKNEMLFNKYNINYAKIEPVYRKGSILIRLPADFYEPESEKVEESIERPLNAEEQKFIELNEEEEFAEKAHKLDAKSPNSKSAKRQGKNKGAADSSELKIFTLYEDLIGKEFWIKYQGFVLL